MNAAQRAAQLLTPKEFFVICAWLDCIYGANARKFDIVGVERNLDKTLRRVEFILLDGMRKNLTVATVRDQAAQKLKEIVREREKYNDIA